jgi:hypothetical protein
VDKKGKTMATTYFGSKPVSDWTANGPASSGHNFIDQINEQKDVISGKQGEYNTQQGQLGDARNAYKDAYKNQQSYSDLYNQAKGEEGVDDARAQYQKSLASVNATNSAMNNLPSSINAGSNVVLNASQRNAALGNQMTKFQNTLDYQTRQNAGDLSQYQTALGAAQDLAKTTMGQEQTKVAQTMQDYQAQMDYANNLYNQLLQERQIMRSIYGDMYEDEYRHMQQELEAWAQNLAAETDRYKEGQANYRAQLSANAQKYAADAGMRLQQYLNNLNRQNNTYKNWDFGNGYQIQGLPGGGATYLRNGQAISAGDFLEHTGANGANWDLWNDVWNNGVSTQGVGSDTVSAFNRQSPTSSRYNYLFGV